MLLGGRKGVGKSKIALDLCYRLVTESKWPDESPAPKFDKIGWLDAERTSSIMVERVAALEFPAKSLVMLGPESPYSYRFDDKTEGIKLLKKDILDLGLKLIVVDSLNASAPSLKEKDAEGLGKVALILQGIASDTGCTILAPTHLRKPFNSGGDAPQSERVTPDDFRGSGAIIYYARVLLGAWKHEGEDHQFAVVGGNFNQDVDPLIYRHEEKSLEWKGVLKVQDTTEKARAVEFLHRTLNGAHVLSKDLFAAAAKESPPINEKTLRRSKKDAGVECKRMPNCGPWYWRMIEEGKVH